MSKTKKIAYLLPLLPLLVIVAGAKKFKSLSAPPSDEKDCHLLYPFLPETTDNSQDLVIQDPINLNFFQTGGVINDISCLNETPVFGVVKVKTENDIKQALAYAQEKSLTVSPAGVRHSMGGQAFAPNGVVLDMLNFNQMSLNEDTSMLRVQSGATWHDIQKFIHPKGLSVKAMQSSDIFSVGGSISVNAHGMDHRVGSLGSTIKSMRIMLHDGSIVEVSPTENAELYHLVIGGYGLFGVILEAEIELTPNEVYERDTTVIPYQDFEKTFEKINSADSQSGLFYGHLSTGPHSFLKEVIMYNYVKADDFQGEMPPLQTKPNVLLKRFFLNVAKTGRPARQLKYWAEKYLQPHFESCTITRNAALGEGEACLVSRNQEMHESGTFLRNSLPNDTDILQEYFIPRSEFVPFVDGMREILERNDAAVLNAGVRVVNKEDNFLNYAPEDMFAMVLYLNQKTTPEENQKMATVTSELIDLTLKHGGKPYLPYQLHFTDKQLHQAYPNIDEFFELKRKYDPNSRFVNAFYKEYGVNAD